MAHFSLFCGFMVIVSGCLKQFGRATKRGDRARVLCFCGILASLSRCTIALVTSRYAATRPTTSSWIIYCKLVAVMAIIASLSFLCCANDSCHSNRALLCYHFSVLRPGYFRCYVAACGCLEVVNRRRNPILHEMYVRQDFKGHCKQKWLYGTFTHFVNIAGKTFSVESRCVYKHYIVGQQ